eukprot:Lankesteria_metandrocarpae@DN5314_c0_g1_i1.p1
MGGENNTEDDGKTSTEEIFAIQDFTTVTPLEKFTREVEKIIMHWSSVGALGPSHTHTDVQLTEDLSAEASNEYVYRLSYVRLAPFPHPLLVRTEKDPCNKASRAYSRSAAVAVRTSDVPRDGARLPLPQTHDSASRQSSDDVPRCFEDLHVPCFHSRTRRIRRWFGLSEYLVLDVLKKYRNSNVHNGKLPTVHVDVNDAKYLLSGMLLALSSVKPRVYLPCFVSRSGDPSFLYSGRAVLRLYRYLHSLEEPVTKLLDYLPTIECDSNKRIATSQPFLGVVSYESSSDVLNDITRGQHSICHLSGAVDLFRAKMRITEDVFSRCSVTSVRLTYVTDDFPSVRPYSFPILKDPNSFSAPISVNYSNGDSCASDGTFDQYPFYDVISAFHLSCTWPALQHGELHDSRTSSELEPHAAPIWSLRVICPSSESIRSLLDVKAFQQINLSGNSGDVLNSFPRTLRLLKILSFWNTVLTAKSNLTTRTKHHASSGKDSPLKLLPPASSDPSSWQQFIEETPESVFGVVAKSVLNTINTMLLPTDSELNTMVDSILRSKGRLHSENTVSDLTWLIDAYNRTHTNDRDKATLPNAYKDVDDESQQQGQSQRCWKEKDETVFRQEWNVHGYSGNNKPHPFHSFGIRNIPPDSLLVRFARVVAGGRIRGIEAIFKLWSRIVGVLRRSVESSDYIPRVHYTQPDGPLGTSQPYSSPLHQHLQAVNVAIAARRNTSLSATEGQPSTPLASVPRNRYLRRTETCHQFDLDSLREPIVPVFPYISVGSQAVTLAQLRSHTSANESNPSPGITAVEQSLLHLVSSFRARNPHSTFGDFQAWWHLHYDGLPCEQAGVVDSVLNAVAVLAAKTPQQLWPSPVAIHQGEHRSRPRGKSDTRAKHGDTTPRRPSANTGRRAKQIPDLKPSSHRAQWSDHTMRIVTNAWELCSPATTNRPAATRPGAEPVFNTEMEAEMALHAIEFIPVDDLMLELVNAFLVDNIVDMAALHSKIIKKDNRRAYNNQSRSSEAVRINVEGAPWLESLLSTIKQSLCYISDSLLLNDEDKESGKKLASVYSSREEALLAVLKAFATAELKSARLQSLKAKLGASPSNYLLRTLLTDEEVICESHGDRLRVARLFQLPRLKSNFNSAPAIPWHLSSNDASSEDELEGCDPEEEQLGSSGEADCNVICGGLFRRPNKRVVVVDDQQDNQTSWPNQARKPHITPVIENEAYCAEFLVRSFPPASSCRMYLTTMVGETRVSFASCENLN